MKGKLRETKSREDQKCGDVMILWKVDKYLGVLNRKIDKNKREY